MRRVLNTADDAHFSPPMAAISLRNLNAMEGFLQVGARYWDKKINGKLPRQAKQQHDLTIGKCSRICVSLLHTAQLLFCADTHNRNYSGTIQMLKDEQLNNAIQQLQTNSEDLIGCSYCGVATDDLQLCSGCGLARYCSKK